MIHPDKLVLPNDASDSQYRLHRQTLEATEYAVRESNCACGRLVAKSFQLEGQARPRTSSSPRNDAELIEQDVGAGLDSRSHGVIMSNGQLAMILLTNY